MEPGYLNAADFANRPDNPYTCPGHIWHQPAWRFGALASDTARSISQAELSRLVAIPAATVPVLLIASACNDWIGAELQHHNRAFFPMPS